jgi:hypothetical protein
MSIAQNLPDFTLTAPEKELIQLLRGLRFGAIEVHVHETRIVQIERRERRRFDDVKAR